MPDYDFKALSPIDFEFLVRDLLQTELNITLESFKSGRDQGIDLRFSPTTDNHLIVQCKHYSESKFSNLLSNLKSEVKKVKKLHPQRYILAISLGLTPGQKDELIELFHPFITKSSDIYGKNDLNGLLVKFPQIEKSTLKLWMSNIRVLEEILHSSVKNVSRDELEKIRKDTKYYVQNESFFEALKILDKYNVCIIAGIPGIGKTILAEMLLLHYINQKYEVIKISSDISEASAVDHGIEKKIFYYDDFLGQTSLSEKLNKNEDQKLLNFIEKTRESKISKFILTTREYILNQARMTYEKLSRAKFNTEMCIVDLSKYTRMNRAKILFNHIYFSDLPMSYKTEILKEKNYLKIIDHENYSPRIVDLMTEYSRVKDDLPLKYFKNFIENLNHPLEIWRHAFEEQLSQASKNLLLVMVTVPDEIFLKDLKAAFEKFHFKQAKEFLYKILPVDFMRALKELEGNFILIKKGGAQSIIHFHNPSIRDFLRDHLSSSGQELVSLVQSAVFFEQLMLLWQFREERQDKLKFREIILKNPSEFIDALKRTIFLKSCRVYPISTPHGNIYKEVGSISFEERIVLVAAMYKNSPETKIKLYFEESLKKVEKRIEEGLTEQSELIRLIAELKKLNLISYNQNKNFLNKIKSFLINELNCLDDFDNFLKFKNLFPKIITTSDVIFTKKEFEEIIENYDSEYLDADPDDYRNEAYQIRIIGDILDVDVEYEVDRLRDYAEELEAEIPPEPDYDEHRQLTGRNDASCSDLEIISMFDTIK